MARPADELVAEAAGDTHARARRLATSCAGEFLGEPRRLPVLRLDPAALARPIPSQQRATILSFDSMIGSTGGLAFQPILGRSADVWGYAGSYVLAAGISAFALPFVLLSRRENVPADQAVGAPGSSHDRGRGHGRASLGGRPSGPDSRSRAQTWNSTSRGARLASRSVRVSVSFGDRDRDGGHGHRHRSGFSAGRRGVPGRRRDRVNNGLGGLALRRGVRHCRRDDPGNGLAAGRRLPFYSRNRLDNGRGR
jgi:hypothetical protein